MLRHSPRLRRRRGHSLTCPLPHQRDRNAATNIYQEGLRPAPTQSRQGAFPVSEVAVRPGNGLPLSEFRIPQGFARGSTSKVHLRHQIIGELVVYLNAATLRVRHQQAAVRRVEHHGGGLGEGPLWLRTMDLTAALEIVRISGYGH